MVSNKGVNFSLAIKMQYPRRNQPKQVKFLRVIVGGNNITGKKLITATAQKNIN